MSPFHVEDALEVFERDGVVQPKAAVRTSHSERRAGQAHILNSGVALYLVNSSSHASCVMGGTTPVMGFHSVILNPDSVKRVTPPTTTTANTSTDETMSHMPTETGGGGAVPGVAASIVASVTVDVFCPGTVRGIPSSAVSFDVCLDASRVTHRRTGRREIPVLVGAKRAEMHGRDAAVKEADRNGEQNAVCGAREHAERLLD
ncbi:unnamed protein product [Mycena citricolor]|uniref:Uncharacterized protein n=1 Tax=Mycena citricolor TaxID=2018698 RepID=A0AAD2Q4M7_9AGAR|nr:unnamed protein product [Mycena citricolor]